MVIDQNSFIRKFRKQTFKALATTRYTDYKTVLSGIGFPASGFLPMIKNL